MKSIRKKMENKGFTLVEIIVCLAIMTIVAGSVGAFIVTGNNSYLRGNKELTLQEEAQLAANQMIDLIIDVEKDIKFTNPTIPAPAVDLDGNPAKDDAGNEVQAQVSELLLVNNDNAYMIRWQGSSNTGTEYENANQVYLYEAATEADLATAAPALMAEHVSSFQVDLREARSKRKVILNMQFAYQDKTYQISETIKLRNALPEDTAEHIWLEAMAVIPTNPTVEQGATKRFDYELKGEPEAVALAKKQGVSWSLSRVDGTACDKSSIINKGTVSVGAEETIGNDILRVTCVLNADPTFTATTTINVKQLEIKSLTLSPEYVELLRGETQQYTYTLVGSPAAEALGVTWSVERMDGYTKSSGTSINPDSGLLTIAADERAGVRALRVTCTAKADNSWKAYGYVTVTKARGLYDATLIRDALKTYTYNDPVTGKEKVGWCADLECLTGAVLGKGSDGKTYPIITWEVAGNPDGYTFEETAKNPSIYRQCLKCSYNTGKTIRVIATVQLSPTDFIYPDVDIVIPELNIEDATKDPYIASSQFVLTRNDKIDVTLMNYFDPEKYPDRHPEDVTWKIANDVQLGLAEANPTRDNSGADSGMGRRVGFSERKIVQGKEVWNLGGWDTTPVSSDITGQQTQDANTRNLYATTTGASAYLYAKWYIDNKAYELELQAWDKNGLIATTYVLIPACEFYFSLGNRSYDLDSGSTAHYYQKVYVNVYGYNHGSGAFGNDWHTIPLEAVLFADKKLSDGTNFGNPQGVTTNPEGTERRMKVHEQGTNPETGDQTFLTPIVIDSNEKNEEIYLKFIDLRTGETLNNRVTTVFWRK